MFLLQNILSFIGLFCKRYDCIDPTNCSHPIVPLSTTSLIVYITQSTALRQHSSCTLHRVPRWSFIIYILYISGDCHACYLYFCYFVCVVKRRSRAARRQRPNLPQHSICILYITQCGHASCMLCILQWVVGRHA